MALVNKQLKTVFVFGAVMLGAYFVLLAMRDTDIQPTVSDVVPPSIFLEGANITTFSEESGRRIWVLQSPAVRYFDASQLVVADTPLLTVHESDHIPPWIIQAGRGAIYRQESLIRLNQGVSMQQTFSEGNIRSITTARIDYFPNREYAEAIYPVEVSSPTGFTRGDQLKIWLDREYLELSGNVENHYVPSR